MACSNGFPVAFSDGSSLSRWHVPKACHFPSGSSLELSDYVYIYIYVYLSLSLSIYIYIYKYGFPPGLSNGASSLRLGLGIRYRGVQWEGGAVHGGSSI